MLNFWIEYKWNCILELKSYAFVSAYHQLTGEKLGSEKQKTFFSFVIWIEDRGYRDYAYVDKRRLLGFEILENDIIKNSEVDGFYL